MTKNINESQCPFCKRLNYCAIQDNASCWCHNVTIPAELINLIPDELKNKSCICNNCIEKFSQSPESFLHK